jgi:hypothetical protein
MIGAEQGKPMLISRSWILMPQVKRATHNLLLQSSIIKLGRRIFAGFKPI